MKHNNRRGKIAVLVAVAMMFLSQVACGIIKDGCPVGSVQGPNGCDPGGSDWQAPDQDPPHDFTPIFK